VCHYVYVRSVSVWRTWVFSKYFFLSRLCCSLSFFLHVPKCNKRFIWVERCLVWGMVSPFQFDCGFAAPSF
jgi:hypothetical protein